MEHHVMARLHFGIDKRVNSPLTIKLTELIRVQGFRLHSIATNTQQIIYKISNLEYQLTNNT